MNRFQRQLGLEVCTEALPFLFTHIGSLLFGKLPT
jgi:hypothetical protein